jgi:hypothetical protein
MARLGWTKAPNQIRIGGKWFADMSGPSGKVTRPVTKGEQMVRMCTRNAIASRGGMTSRFHREIMGCLRGRKNSDPTRFWAIH